MSFFTPQEKVIDLGGGNTVTVRKRTFGQEQKIISECTSADPMKQTSSVDVAGLRQKQLIISVTAWDGPDFDGRPANPDNILALPAEIVELIEVGIESLNAPQDDSEKKVSD